MQNLRRRRRGLCEDGYLERLDCSTIHIRRVVSHDLMSGILFSVG
jgi:hypothetical protein